MEGYFWDLEFDQNIVQDSVEGKISWQEMGLLFWLLPTQWDSPKFRHGMRDFFACLSGIQENNCKTI